MLSLGQHQRILGLNTLSPHGLPYLGLPPLTVYLHNASKRRVVFLPYYPLALTASQRHTKYLLPAKLRLGETKKNIRRGLPAPNQHNLLRRCPKTNNAYGQNLAVQIANLSKLWPCTIFITIKDGSAHIQRR